MKIVLELFDGRKVEAVDVYDADTSIESVNIYDFDADDFLGEFVGHIPTDIEEDGMIMDNFIVKVEEELGL